MNNRIRTFLSTITLTKLSLLLWAVVAIAVIAIVLWLGRAAKGTTVTTEISEKIDPTPTIITAMKEIGEWEFLAINDEEMVDTVKKGIFKDAKLVRIYYGKLSLGLNMQKAGGNLAVRKGDTLTISLPPIELLDNNFIDEARTRAFIETGTWTDADREMLYRKARNKMLKRCMTRENINTAQENARTQIIKMTTALGADNVKIRFEEKKTK